MTVMTRRAVSISRFVIVSAIMSVVLIGHAHAQRKASGPTPVFVAPVNAEMINDRIEALGTAQANETAVISADTTDKIEALFFEGGEVVEAGYTLAQLDKKEEEADLRAAQASLVQARADLKRASSLKKNSVLSQSTYDDRLSAVRQREAAVDSLLAQLENLEIIAPFAGIVGIRNVSVGALVRPGDVIATLDNIEKIKLDFDVPSIYLAALRKGVVVRASTEAYPDKVFSGVIDAVNTQIDPITRTITVRAVIDNVEQLIKPGLLMHVSLETNARQTLMIDEEALVKNGQTNAVFVVTEKDGKTIVSKREITIGSRKNGMVEALSGLTTADQIVVHGTLKLRDGAEIVVKAIEDGRQTLDQLLGQESAERPSSLTKQSGE